MRYPIILITLLLWTLLFLPASGQIIADFNFQDISDVPASLLKNSVPGAPDALAIHPNARGADGGVYVLQDESVRGHENINLDVPDELFTPYGSVYLEWEWMVQEESLWLIHGRGTNNSGIYHSSLLGFNIRYYTKPAPDAEPVYHYTDFAPPAISPLENNVISKIGFHYNQEEGLAYLYVNGELKWRSDSHFDPTPGAPLVWVYEENYLTIGANANGEGSETPSLYRFRMFETPCPPVAAPVASGAEICPGEQAVLTAGGGEDGNYLWFDSENAEKPIEGETGSTFTTPELNAPKTYFVALSDGDCQSERIPAEVSVLSLPDAPSVTGGERCGPGTVTLTAKGGTEGSYLWYRNATDADPVEGEVNSTYTTENLSASGAFYVSVKGEKCESERVRVEAVVHPVPAPPVSQTVERCGPGEVTIDIKMQNSTDASAFQWFRRQEDSAPSHEGNNNILVVDAVKDTTVYVRSYNGNCFSEKVPVYIKINPLPALNAGEDKTILKGESVQLLASGDITEVKWSPSSGLDMNDILTPVASPAFSTTYVVTGKNASGCEITDTLTVNVVQEYPVPNAFSPNNDGLNDYWEIPGIENYPECKIMIFNRWGNQIFYSEGYQEPWDGTFNGREPEPGTYYFTIILNNELDPVKGTLAIVR